MKLILLSMALGAQLSFAQTIGVYNSGGNLFQYVRGDYDYVSARVTGRPGAQLISRGCCAGGITGYFGRREFNWGTACASTLEAAEAAAAAACESRYPHWKCDYRMTSECS